MRREHPMLFKDRMVRALLDGSKTQTRRPPRKQPKQRTLAVHSDHPEDVWEMPIGRCRSTTNWRRRMVYSNATGVLEADEHYLLPVEEWLLEFCPYSVGDLIWCRETWAEADDEWGAPCSVYAADLAACHIGRDETRDNYLLNDWHTFDEEPPRWTPSIHMPKWACRLWLEITDVRVERVQDISHGDVLAEGTQVPVTEDGSLIAILSGKNPPCDFWPVKTFDELRARPDFMEQWYRSHFASSWSAIYPGSWERNDWVWAISYKRTEAKK